MNASEYLTYLEQNATELVTYGPSAREVDRAKRRTDRHTPKVYNEATVVKLLRKLSENENEVRFVIDPQGKPLFGSMGPVEDYTPGHEEMSNGLCLTAGIITFQKDDDTNTITGITKIACESGFFKPELKSLIWILHYLCSNQHTLLTFCSDTLTIRYYEDNSWERINVQVSSLKSLFERLSPKAAAPAVEPYRTFSEEIVAQQIANRNPGSPSSMNSSWTKRPPRTPHHGNKYHDSDNESNDAAPSPIPKKSRYDHGDSLWFPSSSSSLPPSCQSNSTASTDDYRSSGYDMRLFNPDKETKFGLYDLFAETNDNTSPNI